MSFTTPVSRSTSTSTAWAPNGQPGAAKPFPSPDISCPKSFALNRTHADDLSRYAISRRLRQNSSIGGPSPKLSYRQDGGLGRQVPEPSGRFQQLPPGICRSELYGGTDIGSHPARISPVVKRSQLRIGDDNVDFAQWNTQFFGGDLAQAVPVPPPTSVAPMNNSTLPSAPTRRARWKKPPKSSVTCAGARHRIHGSRGRASSSA